MADRRGALGRLVDWLDDRTGWGRATRRALEEPIRGGSRWSYVFGSALLFLFALQATTGIFLALYYVPSSDHAHASLAYIQKAVPGGRLLRGLHYYGSSAMVVLLVVHIAQTFFFGAYKGRRELIWIAGVVLALLTLGFAFTGYLLPWDQTAYFGTKVGASIAGEIPLVGRVTERILLGGMELSSLTLSRFFMAHVFLLPLAFGLLAAVHVVLFRRAGPAGPYHDGAKRSEPFYPLQLLKDSVFILLLFVALLALAELMPAELGPQADPTADYLARPAWYFLPLFQLLKYFRGRLVVVPAVLLPGLLLAMLVLLPFLDRSPERHPRRRPLAVSVFAVVLSAIVGLAVLSYQQDRINPESRARLEQQKQDAASFMRATFQPQDIGRSVAISIPEVTHPAESLSPALKVFLANCASCHGADATGGPLGPSLVNLSRRRRLTAEFIENWIEGHAREPSADSMPKFNQLPQQERRLLAQWVIQLGQPVQQQQPAVHRLEAKLPPGAFGEHCSMCHGERGEGNIGPPVLGVASKPNRSEEDLYKMLGDSRVFGLKDPMPQSFPALSEQDKRAIAAWLATLR